MLASVKIHSSKQLSAQSQSKAETNIPFNVQDSLQVPEMKQQRSHKKITSKDLIMRHYPDVFEEIGKFPGPPYTIHLDPSIPAKTNTLQASTCTSERNLQKRIRQDAPGWCVETFNISYSLD